MSSDKNELAAPKGEVLVYQTEAGEVKVDVRLEDETVWLTQQMMAELFQTTVPNISMHMRNIYTEGELIQEATVKKFLTVRKEGRRDVRRELEYYNLDMIISVGYRVKSLIATRFRIWATQRLKEAGDSRYFEELLARIRDIRSSEKVFWRKVLDIFATSIDYDPGSEESCLFFQQS